MPTLTTPATYGYAYPNCPSTQTSDTLSFRGIDPTQRLQGQILVRYVTSTGTVLAVPGNPDPIPVNVDGSSLVGGAFDVTVFYPPASQWPVMDSGTSEVHVGIQIEVWVYQGSVVQGTLGPGKDFDVFCIGNPAPTATPTSTSTPVPPTATATSTATPVPPTATPTNTATPVPPTATATSTATPVPPTATATSTPTKPCPTGSASLVSYSYLINGTTVVNDLSGRIRQGDTVEVRFQIAANCTNIKLSLVTYKAPTPTFSATNANQQVVFNSDTGSFNSGNYRMTVKVPSCYFQIDFVFGSVIQRLGPAGSNNFYSAQGRLIDADNGGTRRC